MTAYLYKQELDELMAQFELASKMDDEQIQTHFNCDDTKEQFLEYLETEIGACEERYEDAKLQEESDANWETAGLDPAFRCWRDVYAMFI